MYVRMSCWGWFYSVTWKFFHCFTNHSLVGFFLEGGATRSVLLCNFPPLIESPIFFLSNSIFENKHCTKELMGWSSLNAGLSYMWTPSATLFLKPVLGAVISIHPPEPNILFNYLHLPQWIISYLIERGKNIYFALVLGRCGTGPCGFHLCHLHLCQIWSQR